MLFDINSSKNYNTSTRQSKSSIKYILLDMRLYGD